MIKFISTSIVASIILVGGCVSSETIELSNGQTVKSKVAVWGKGKDKYYLTMSGKDAPPGIRAEDLVWLKAANLALENGADRFESRDNGTDLSYSVVGNGASPSVRASRSFYAYITLVRDGAIGDGFSRDALSAKELSEDRIIKRLNDDPSAYTPE
ncbi:MAG: hypothetical protein ABNH53_11520 [Henriciella sp.]|jgi:hypothetical protein